MVGEGAELGLWGWRRRAYGSRSVGGARGESSQARTLTRVGAGEGGKAIERVVVLRHGVATGGESRVRDEGIGIGERWSG